MDLIIPSGQEQKKLEFIQKLVDIIRAHPRFGGDDIVGRGNNAPSWSEVLEWWLNPNECRRSPGPKKVSDWYYFVYSNFDYRFNWGLSSVLSIAFDDAIEDKTKPLTLEDWPLSNLPWIGFWIKELIVWGTLEPVAAFLMSKRYAWTRKEAEDIAEDYYKENNSDDPNELLNPSTIRDWCKKRFPRKRGAVGQQGKVRYSAELLRDFSNQDKKEWRVIPVTLENDLVWTDLAGFPLAKSKKPKNWNPNDLNIRDFILLDKEKSVISSAYI